MRTPPPPPFESHTLPSESNQGGQSEEHTPLRLLSSLSSPARIALPGVSKAQSNREKHEQADRQRGARRDYNTQVKASFFRNPPRKEGSERRRALALPHRTAPATDRRSTRAERADPRLPRLVILLCSIPIFIYIFEISACFIFLSFTSLLEGGHQRGTRARQLTAQPQIIPARDSVVSSPNYRYPPPPPGGSGAG